MLRWNFQIGTENKTQEIYIKQPKYSLCTVWMALILARSTWCAQPNIHQMLYPNRTERETQKLQEIAPLHIRYDTFWLVCRYSTSPFLNIYRITNRKKQHRTITISTVSFFWLNCVCCLYNSDVVNDYSVGTRICEISLNIGELPRSNNQKVFVVWTWPSKFVVVA